MSSTASSPAATASWRSSSVLLLAAVTVTSTINWADRQFVPILFPAMKADLGLSDTELGLIGGPAFSLIYALAAFVFGYLADRVSRRAVLAWGLVIASVATAAGGLAAGFGSLFAARFLAGIGEASLYPCVMSLIADTFAPETRGRAIGIYGASIAVGSGLGVGLGGRLVELVGWRDVYYIYGAAGVIALPFLLAMREPPRTAEALATDHDPPARVIREAFADTRLLAIWIPGMAMIAAAFGFTSWAPTYFAEELGFSMTETGAIFGGGQLVGGVVGSLIGGRLGDAGRLRRRAGQLDICVASALVTLPLFVLLTLGLPAWFDVALALVAPVAAFAYFPSLQTMVAELVPAKRLGLTFAVHALFLGGLGTALGPLLVGAVSDATGSLRIALLVPAALILYAALGIAWAGRFLRRRMGE